MTETLVAVSPPSPKKRQDATDPGGPPPGEAFGPILQAGPEREFTPAEFGGDLTDGHSGQGRRRGVDRPGWAAQGADRRDLRAPGRGVRRQRVLGRDLADHRPGDRGNAVLVG